MLESNLTFRRAMVLCLALIAFFFGAARECRAQQPAAEPISHFPLMLHIKAIINGSDVLTISNTSAIWQHKYGDPPTHVSINGKAWDVQPFPRVANTGETQFFRDPVDFSTARVVQRHGRDMLAVEVSNDQIQIYFDDTALSGPSEYTVKIEFDRQKNSAKPKATNGH